MDEPLQITWQYDPGASIVEHHPATAAEAITQLSAGNERFASLGERRSYIELPVSADDLGFGAVAGEPPRQTPHAVLLACADARVPPELVFTQSANDLFTVRVAGNVLGAECVGSMDYAVTHLPTVRLLAVMGHTSCGAVSAAVDVYLDPVRHAALAANLPLRAIIDAILAPVRAADQQLQRSHGEQVVRRPGYRAALIDFAVLINAAEGAAALESYFAGHLGDHLAVAYGVFDLASRRVGVPALEGGDDWQDGLHAPIRPSQYGAVAAGWAQSRHITDLLESLPSRGH